MTPEEIEESLYSICEVCEGKGYIQSSNIGQRVCCYCYGVCTTAYAIKHSELDSNWTLHHSRLKRARQKYKNNLPLPYTDPDED